MSFVRSTPTRRFYRTTEGSPSANVRVTFYGTKTKGRRLKIFIGKHILNQLGWKKGDIIEFFSWSDQPLKWFIKKGKDGWTLTDFNKKGEVFVMEKGTTELEDINYDENQGVVSTTMFDGGLIIYLPKCPMEDRFLPKDAVYSIKE